MKKIALQILLLMIFLPFIVNAENCDIDKITISSITIEKKSANVEELERATTNGRNINLKLSMSEVGDNIKYKFVIKNDSLEDYEIDKTSLNINSDYINYSFETDDNSNIVRANSSKNVTLIVEYKTEIQEDKFENGIYNDDKTMAVKLSKNNTINILDTIKNPNTGVQSRILIFLILLLVSESLYILLKKNKISKFIILIIATTIIIPIGVSALCKYEIELKSSVTIKKEYKVAYLESSFNMLLTDDEFEKCEKTIDTKCDIVYIGETKYNYCINIIFTDSDKYIAGTQVTLKPLIAKHLNHNVLQTCTLNEDESYSCPDDTIISNHTNYTYSYGNLYNNYGYTYNTNDKAIMNFSNINHDYWDNYNVLNIGIQAFTMPAHDVLFDAYWD